MGQRPQLRVHTSKLYGKMMRRLIDTECRQVCELQHTHKQCTESKVAKRTGEAGRERDEGVRGFPPVLVKCWVLHAAAMSECVVENWPLI